MRDSTRFPVAQNLL